MVVIGAALAIALAASGVAERGAPLDQSKRLEVECAFGAERLKEFLAKPMSPNTVLGDAPVHQSPISAPNGQEQFVDAWKARGPTNLFVACPNLRSLVPGHLRFATDNDRAETVEAITPNRVSIREFSAPMLSADGKSMLFETSERCPGLCGMGTVEMFKKSGSQWSVSDRLALWLS